MRIYKQETEVREEEDYYRDLVNKQFEQMIGNRQHSAYAMPFLSYPTKLDCLGLRPASPKVEIKEGFMRLSYDFFVKEANEKCLFDK